MSLSHRRRWPELLLCLALFPLLLRAATIEGRVTLPASKGTTVMNQRYEIVTKGGILSTNPPSAVVWVEGDFPAPDAPPPAAEVTQKGMVFIPALLPIRTGTKVEFPNFDDTYHNIFSYSAAKRFDLGRYRPDERPVPSVVFDKAGLVVLRCDIHEHMRGLILVLASSYFVQTDLEGNFKLTGLPAGRHTVKAWVNSKTTIERIVELTEGATTKIDFP